MKPYFETIAQSIPLKSKKHSRRSKFLNEELSLPNNFGSIRKISNEFRGENQPFSEKKSEETS